jgi:Ca-activated chloride channel family protein
MTTTVAGTGTAQAYESNGGRLVALDGRALPLRGVNVRAEAAGGLARVVLEQRFGNPYQEPLQVSYSVPLPAEGAVAGYAFRIGERRVVGEIDRRAAARERFEAAILEGRTAALLDQERQNLFSQEVGNVPPGQEVTVELTVDQRLRWLAEGLWEWRFPTVAPPRYLGAPGRVADAAHVTVDVADGPTGVRAALELSLRDALVEGRAPESPSHRVAMNAVAGETGPCAHIVFADEAGAALDRDLVVRWAVAQPRVGATLECARPAAGKPHGGDAYGLLTIVPPSAGAPEARALPRDLCVLLDTSGSMGGRPLDHARRVVSAVVDSLGEADQLEMIAFSTRPHRWQGRPVPATAAARREALKWLAELSAGGGTEMHEAVKEALSPLRADAQRQVVLVTDGHIGFETEVVGEVIAHLPPSSRLHTVAVGSSTNRALTGPAARAGHGLEIVVDLDEDAERGAARLVAATRAPLLVDVTVEGEAVRAVAPRALPDLFAAAPALVSVRLRAEGGALVVRGRTPAGAWEQHLAVAPCEAGTGNAAVVALFGRESVEDLETALAGGRADRREADATIERLGLEFGLATRLTSWVAVSEEATVDPRAPVRHERMPQDLPSGLSAEGLGLRAAFPGGAAGGAMLTRAGALGMPLAQHPAQRAVFTAARHGFMASAAAPGGPMQPPKAPAPAPAPMGPPMAAPKRKVGGAGAVLGRAADALREMASRARDAFGSVERKEAPDEEAGSGGFGGSESWDADVPADEAPAPLGPEAWPEAGREPEADTGNAAGPEPEPEPEDDGEQVLHGRIVRLKDGELLVEIDVEGAPLDWDPVAAAELTLADGTTQASAVVDARTTRGGRVPPGARIRLCVAAAGLGGAPAPAAVVLHTHAGATVRILL